MSLSEINWCHLITGEFCFPFFPFGLSQKFSLLANGLAPDFINFEFKDYVGTSEFLTHMYFSAPGPVGP